jgi:hypothetical protein
MHSKIKDRKKARKGIPELLYYIKVPAPFGQKNMAGADLISVIRIGRDLI